MLLSAAYHIAIKLTSVESHFWQKKEEVFGDQVERVPFDIASIVQTDQARFLFIEATFATLRSLSDKR